MAASVRDRGGQPGGPVGGRGAQDLTQPELRPNAAAPSLAATGADAATMAHPWRVMHPYPGGRHGCQQAMEVAVWSSAEMPVRARPAPDKRLRRRRGPYC